MNIDTLRHSAAHVLAHAVKNLFPKVKLGIGPTIEDGFYYDFDKKTPFTPDDLKKIEAEMQKLTKENHKFKKVKPTQKETKDFLKHEPYKKELYADLKKAKAHPTFYKNGKFLDLCTGPHIKSSSQIKAFKLLKIAGAYWKGDSSNPQLQRIYGTAFPTKRELKKYLKFLEEVAKRDHRKIGKEMDLFSFHEEAPGMPFFHNKGTFLWYKIVDFVKDLMIKKGYEINKTPIILNKNLWMKSGHWEHYKENMYATKIDKQDFLIKPMNCPGNILIYKTKLHSYKEFPIKAGEFGLVHRHELSGVLCGLFRVRAFTQDDAHVFCTKEQMKDELKALLDFADEVYSVFGFDYHLELSTKPKKAMGNPKLWKLAEKILRGVLKKSGKKYRINPGEGTFYGPKIDVHIKDAIGRTWQCATIQLDFQMPERFDLTYEGKDGKKHRPIMIHRTIIGSVERFIGILLEHNAGALPLWLSPTQVLIITVSDKHKKFAGKIKEQLETANIRVKLDDRAESVNKKIRESQLQKIPAVITIGDKEIKSKTLAIRTLDGKVRLGMKLDKFIKNITKLIENKT